MFKNRWWIVGASTMALIFSSGSIQLFSASLFIKPITTDLGLGRGTLSTAFGIHFILSAIATPIFGRLIDQRGVRALMLPTITLYALATAALALLPSSIPIIFAMFAVVGTFGVAQTPTPYSKVVSWWFDRQRGLALAVTLAGIGLGTIIVPQVAVFLMTHFNWRVGYLGLGCAVLIFALLPNALIIREPPNVERAEAARAMPDVPGLTFAEARTAWRYWTLSLAFYLAATVINGSLVHIVPMLTDRGIPIGVATAALSATGVALIIGRLCSGWIIDRVFAPYVAMVFMLVPMFGIAVLGFGFGGISPVIGTICLGMGIGAEIDIMAFLVGRYFGLRQYGTLYGVMFAIAILGNATGSNLLGWSFQFFNSYTPALVLFEVFLVAAALCFLGLGPYRYAAPARDIEVDTPQIKPSAA
jgi:MFS family permease